MKLKEKDKQKFIAFLEKFKNYVGFSDWKILLSIEAKPSDFSFAGLEVDIQEKTLKIEVDTEFMGLPDSRKTNILFHELVHGRVTYAKQKIAEYTNIEEEHMVNDLVRGFEAFGDLKFRNI